MAAADVVVISSVWEALPLVLIEALQLGRPVVSTDVGVARELLDGDAAGDVVPVGDAPALAAALIDRLTGSRSPGQAGGHVATAERFAPDALIDAVVDVYRELW
jgi:glycosyltransferase involved in cell wall biosynthesis